MKKLLIVVLSVFCGFYAQAQEKDQVFETFERYTDEGIYTVDGNSIVVSRVIENLPGSKDEIYTRAKAYIVRSYNSAKAVIQTDDKDNGLIIIEGIYPRLIDFQMNARHVKAPHTIRIDIKNGRARVICNAEQLIPYSATNNDGKYAYDIIRHFPFTKSKTSAIVSKKLLAEAFNSLVDRMNGSIDKIEEALKEGGTLEIEKEEW